VATVLVHGHPETAEIWNPIIPLLGREVITPRLPSVVLAGRAEFVTHGGSRPVGAGDVICVAAGERHRFEKIADDLLALIVWCPPFGSQGATA
jgi:hypothetical protein